MSSDFDPDRYLARVTLARPREQSPRTHHVQSVTLPKGGFVWTPAWHTSVVLAVLQLACR